MGANTSKHHQALASSSSTTSTSKKSTNNRLPPQKIEDLVDLGTVFPNGLYPATEQDYDARIVRKLIIQRKVAPFYKGLADAPEPVTPTIAVTTSDSTATEPTAATTTPITVLSAPAITSDAAATAVKSSTHQCRSGNDTHSKDNNIPTTTISFSSTSDIPKLLPKPVPHRSVSSSSLLEVSAATRTKHYNNKPLPGRPRSQSHSKVNDASYDPYAERKRAFVEKMKQREKMLYNDAVECPICFLYYPANINYARCCDQPICTECFVQIHRPLDAPSQPATCPYCMVENFGVVYEPPAWSEKAPQQQGRARSGSHGSMTGTRHTTSGIGGMDIPTRRASIDYKDPDVVLVDHVRPNWNKACINTKAHSIRTPVSRRNSVSAANNLSSITTSANASSSNSRPSNSNRSRHNHLFFRSSSSSNNTSSSNSSSRGSSLSSLFVTRPGRSASSAAATEYNQYLTNVRDSNMDLEDWMVMEAIRLSLAEQEERERTEALKKNKRKEQGQSGINGNSSGSSRVHDTNDDNSEPQGLIDTQNDNTSTAASPLSSSSSSSESSLSSPASSTRKETTATTSATSTQPIVN